MRLATLFDKAFILLYELRHRKTRLEKKLHITHSHTYQVWKLMICGASTTLHNTKPSDGARHLYPRDTVLVAFSSRRWTVVYPFLHKSEGFVLRTYSRKNCNRFWIIGTFQTFIASSHRKLKFSAFSECLYATTQLKILIDYEARSETLVNRIHYMGGLKGEKTYSTINISIISLISILFNRVIPSFHLRFL